MLDKNVNKVIRSSSHTLKYANRDKIDLYWKIIKDYKELLQLYLHKIHDGELPLKQNLSSKFCPQLNDISNSRWRALCYREASQIYRSQVTLLKKKRIKKITELVIKSHSINLNYMLWDIEEDKTKEFDCFIKIFSPYFQETKHRAILLKLPINHHRVSLRFKNNGWKLKNSFMLSDNFSLKLFWEKEEAEKKKNKLSAGVDCGYKKLLACSDGKVYGKELEDIYEKISRKKQRSKAFKRALKERDEAINLAVKKFYNEHKDCGQVIIENLKCVKYKSKFSKKFNNKLQRWSYIKVMNKFESLSETEGFQLIKVPPAYTSQRCHVCNTVDKSSRQGDVYHCKTCGGTFDADINAAINILRLGVYGPHDKIS